MYAGPYHACNARLRAVEFVRKEVTGMAKGGKSGGGKSSKGTYRSAVTGRYVTAAYGKGHPNTTVKESGK